MQASRKEVLAKDLADKIAKTERNLAAQANAKTSKSSSSKKKTDKMDIPDSDSARSRSSRGLRGPGSVDGSGDDGPAPAPAPPVAAPVTLESLAATMAAGFGMMAAFTAKFDNIALHELKVDETLASINARLNAQAADLAALKADRVGSSSSAASGPGPAVFARGPPSTSSGAATRHAAPSAADNEFKIFFDRADYPLHRLVLGRYWNNTVKSMAPSLCAGTKPYIGDRDCFAVGFPTEDAAKEFLIELDSLNGAPPLIDSDGHAHTFTARLQRNKAPTKFGKQLSPVFQHYLRTLQTRVGYMKDFTPKCDPHRGRIYIEKNEKLHFIHTLDVTGNTLRTHEEDLEEFGLDIEECRNAGKLFGTAA